MYQSPRLVCPQGNDGIGAGYRSAAAPASVPVHHTPLTPRRTGEALDNLIRSLEHQYQLGFKNKSEWSPARSKTAADVVAKKIQHLFFSSRTDLEDALAAFAKIATSTAQNERLGVLSNILRSKVPRSRTGTPTSTKNVPPRSLDTAQPCKYIQARSHTTTPIEDTPRSRGLFDNYRQQEEASSQRADVPDPGPPTDDDDDEFVTPPSLRALSRSPSPSVTSKSAIRRVEASAHLSLHANSRKQPSDSSHEAEKSPKLTKISKGKQPFNKPQVPASMKPSPSLFKKPSLDMARSFNALPASQSTVNTSFNTMLSSQQIQPDTANTSFTFDVDHTEVPYSYITRTSSTTIGSLDYHDLLNVDARLAKEAVALNRRAEPPSSSSQDRDSSSTWGSSIPEEDLLDASARVESLLALSMALSLNQSFPPPPGVSAMLYPDTSLFQPRNPANDTSPARIKHSSREQTPVDSPSKVSHHIRNIAMQGLFVEDVPEQALVVPYHILFVCQRVAIEWSIPLCNLLREVDVSSAATSPDTPWSALESHPKGVQIKLRETNRLWSAAKQDFTFKGQINLSDRRRGSIFNLELHPIQVDKACRFQRRFGSDRFLYLNTPKPDFTKSGRFNGAEAQLILERWNDWLHAEHSFLGRKWRVFHLEPMKRKTKTKKKPVTHDTRIVLFATRGCGIDEPCSVRDMVNWFIPLERNWEKSFCEVYARLDLGLSRTIPTLVFKPSQITRVRDILANGETEAAEYNDPTLYWKDVPPDQVMNDGCSIMSVGAALEIWNLYTEAMNVKGPLPSAFQGRIGGAKGMWMISAESFTKDPDDLAIWIKISDSQLKFEPHEADLSDDTFDPDRLKFEVSNFTSAPAPSELHIAFIPILVDRGVPRDVIADHMVERMDADRAELLSRLADPVKMYDYIYRRSASSSDKADVQWQAAFPAASDEKIKLLLESGFSPTKLQFLARLVQLFIHQQHLLQESGLKAPLGKATYLIGIADPLGVLKPGEIHVQFSTSFVDELTDESYLNLKGHEVVVGRQPACRRSDMQKVQAVVHPDLSHLVDVVVFPSRGQYPLAGKLQGGDYDGDTFWLCWEDRLVIPFTNAPAPVESPDPAEYGIKQDRRKLSDVMDPHDVDNIDDFLHASFVFRMKKSLLGQVTIFADDLAYAENGIHSPNLDYTHDVHDLLVDAPKQGYTFTDGDFKRMVHQKLQLRPGLLKPKLKLPQPAYKKAIDDCMDQKETADRTRPRNKQYLIKKDSLLDYLYFEVVRAHNEQTMDAIVAALSSATEPDVELVWPHRQQAEDADPVVAEELRQLQQGIGLIYNKWNSEFANNKWGENTPFQKENKKENTPAMSARAVEECYTRFQALQPHNPTHPHVAPWLACPLVPGECAWRGIRASAMYELYERLRKPTAGRFVFAMAGRELADLKARNQPGTRAVVEVIRRR
ncbi:hypothetical protein EJ07DRAFT_99234 [Lizonia empirigonia]|nr:hypothetical protein EJ07DRAFT_99234 [Lizonia empirigonia]